MKKILVPTDFSENAANALDYAVNLGVKTNAEIVILNVFTNIDTTFSSRKKLINEYNAMLCRNIEEQLNELQQRLLLKNATARLTVKIYNGEVHGSILQCAADENADLIVMGTRGASGLKRIFIGSTTANIIGNTTLPVLAIPQEVEWHGLENILFASRHLEVDDNVLIPLFELASLNASQVHVGVFTDTDDSDAADYIEHGELLNLYHQQLPARNKGIQFKTVHLEGNEFDTTVQNYIKDSKIDMLVMTTHKRNFWESIFNGSMTKEMACHINIPLLAIPV
jgi:nucleotide-binding universal stress UspA family protein